MSKFSDFNKCVLVVSDLHCGSIYGLHYPGFVSSDDKVVPCNPAQEYLWECWNNMIEQVKDYPIVATVLNGDLIDGTQTKNGGVELSLPMLADQTECATQVLQFLKKRLKTDPKFYAVQGTEYHIGKAAREEEVIAANLGCLPYRGLGTGRYCREILDLEIDKVIVNCAHHVGGSAGFYRATGIDREAMFSALAGKEGKAVRADVLIRSHLHNFVHVEYLTKHGVITPCWQLQTRYARHKSAYRLIPEIGAVVVWISGQAKKNGEDGAIIQKIWYPIPVAGTVKV